MGVQHRVDHLLPVARMTEISDSGQTMEIHRIVRGLHKKTQELMSIVTGFIIAVIGFERNVKKPAIFVARMIVVSDSQQMQETHRIVRGLHYKIRELMSIVT